MTRLNVQQTLRGMTRCNFEREVTVLAMEAISTNLNLGDATNVLRNEYVDELCEEIRGAFFEDLFEEARARYFAWLEDNFDTSIIQIKHKIGHTLRVIQNSEKLARMMSLSSEQIFIAKIIALLHDIFRAPQLTENASFWDYDAVSEEDKKKLISTINHADGAVQILKADSSELLRYFVPMNWYDHLITSSIWFHSKIEIEEDYLSDEEVFFAKLIRDADKLDSLFARAHLDMMEIEGWEKSKIEKSEISEGIYNAFVEERTIFGPDRDSDADYYFFITAFPFGLYFKEAFEIAVEKNYVAGMRNVVKFSKEHVQAQAMDMFDRLEAFIVYKAENMEPTVAPH